MYCSLSEQEGFLEQTRLRQEIEYGLVHSFPTNRRGNRYNFMYAEKTENICVRVQPRYRPELSDLSQQKFYFSYQVEIINESEFEIRLLSRHWIIFDSAGVKRKVEGKGVVGKQPLIAPGEQFSYESWCPLLSDLGYMRGYYIIERTLDESRQQIIIPKFQFITDYLQS